MVPPGKNKAIQDLSVSYVRADDSMDSVKVVTARATSPDEQSSGSSTGDQEEAKKEETICSFLLESQIPLILAGFGLVGTGLFLHHISFSKFFTEIPVAFTLTTPLLDLKGNLEMNFASRLATCSHTGAMETEGGLWRLVRSNAGLSQSHTITVSFIIAAMCLIIDFSMTGRDVMILLASAVSTASISSIFVDFCLVIVVLVAARFKFNPDNVSTPLAASIGDISTLLIFFSMGWIQLQICSHGFCVLSLIILVVLLATLPFWIWLATGHQSTRDALFTGWITLIISAIISSGGGYILLRVHETYPEFSLLQPLLVGLVGNRCAIQASRLSSSLHVSGKSLGKLPRETLCESFNPVMTFCGGDMHSKVAIVMIVAAIFTQAFFAAIVLLIAGHGNMINLPFFGCYILASVILLILFMYLCQVFVDVFWWLGLDPDFNAIPLLTSLSDFLGTLLLFLVFLFLGSVSPKSINAGSSNTACTKTAASTSAQ